VHAHHVGRAAAGGSCACWIRKRLRYSRRRTVELSGGPGRHIPHVVLQWRPCPMIYLLSLSIGIVAGLRAMTAPAAVSWAAYFGWLKLDESILAFMGYTWTPWVITVLAVTELVTDQLPSTPSRTVPVLFGTRILSGVSTGAALCIAAGSLLIGAVVGAAGAVIGTLGGRAARAALARYFGNDRPAGLLEDAVAITAALLIVRAFL
jgi:uncharacterized membrane protein